MKRLIIGLLALLAVNVTQASEDACKSMEDVAYKTMEARQLGVPKQFILDAIDQQEAPEAVRGVMLAIIEDAYDKPLADSRADVELTKTRFALSAGAICRKYMK